MNLIYKSTNQINGKVYIGQTTTSLEQRKREHESQRNHKNCYFHNALNKYGLENFVWEILEQNIDFNKLNEREQYWIKYYNSNNSFYGYNMTAGGDNQDALNTWRKNNPYLAIECAK